MKCTLWGCVPFLVLGVLGIAQAAELGYYSHPALFGDPQLDKAIEVLLGRFEDDPKEWPTPPPFPDRGR